MSGTGYEKRGDRHGTSGHGSTYGSGDGGGHVFGSGTPKSAGGAFSTPVSKKPQTSTEAFVVGDLVDHKAFGRGRVMSVKGDALEIRFDRTRETKKLLVGYAPIVKIKS